MSKLKREARRPDEKPPDWYEEFTRGADRREIIGLWCIAAACVVAVVMAAVEYLR